jgi:hypothetical protein
MSGLLGNLILFSYFAAKREWGATAVQAVGVASTSVLLAQVPFSALLLTLYVIIMRLPVVSAHISACSSMLTRAHLLSLCKQPASRCG